MITPINGHVLIEPMEMKGFMASQRGTFEEKGVVVNPGSSESIEKGNIVYFDSWLASKYPKNEQEFFWLVNIEDIRAIETDEEISE